MHHYGMTTLELNPIRMRADGNGRLTPVACDFKCGFDRDDPRVAAARAAGPPVRRRRLRLRAGGQRAAHAPGPVGRVRHQREGTILAPTFGGGANCLVTEVLGEAAIISSGLRRQPAVREDEGGRPHLLPPLAGAVQRAVHHRRQVEQHRHPRDASAPWATRCASTSRRMAPTPLYVVVGRGGPEPRARLGRARRHLRGARPAVPLLRLRQRHLRGRQLRQADRRVDEGRRPRRDRAPARHRADRAEPREAAEETHHACTEAFRGFPYFVGIDSLADIATPRRPGLRAQHPRRRIAPGDADQPCLLRRQRRVRHLAGPRRPGAEDPARRHPGLQQRSRRAERRPRLQHRRRLPAALGRARRRRRADPRQPGPEEDRHRHREDRGARRARDPRDGAGRTASTCSAATASAWPTRGTGCASAARSAATIPRKRCCKGIGRDLLELGRLHHHDRAVPARPAAGARRRWSRRARTSTSTTPPATSRIALRNDDRAQGGGALCRARRLLRAWRRLRTSRSSPASSGAGSRS